MEIPWPLRSSLGPDHRSLSWRSGNSRPKKQIERRIHSLIAGDREVAPLFVTEKAIDKLAQVELAISGLLEALREEFHRTATLSSRQDVLDLVTVLFFAHVTSIEQGQRGIGRHLKDRSESAAASLNTFVLDSLNKHLQRACRIQIRSTTLKEMDFHYSAADECFAEKLLEIFESEVESFATHHESGRDDIVNEIFSRFMSTSFVDEKEMGQYLTPPEIVEFMVDLGIRVVGEGIVDHGIILDRSCGVASFLSSTIRSLYSKARTKLTKEQTAQWLCFLLSNRVIGIDKSKRMTKLAELGLALFGAQGVNIYHGNALARTGRDSNLGRWVQLSHDSTRWDASFHIGMPSEFSAMVGSSGSHLRVRGRCRRMGDQRQDPRSGQGTTVKYIEISDVDTKSARMGHRTWRSTTRPVVRVS